MLRENYICKWIFGLERGTILWIQNEWILLLFAFKVYCDKFLVSYSYFHIVQKTISCFNLRTIFYSRTKPIIYGFLGGYTSSFSWIPKFDRTKYWPSKACNFCTKANKNIKDVVLSTCRICYLNRLTNFSREYGHIIYLPINRAPSLSVNNKWERKNFALGLCYF